MGTLEETKLRYIPGRGRKMNFEDIEYRRRILSDIKSPENQDRKDISFRRMKILKGDMHQYVVEKLKENFQEETVKKMPLETNINIATRICSEVASIYREEPNREFVGVDDEQQSVLDKIYRDMKVNYKLLKSNEYFVAERQSILMCVPVNGKLKLRVLPMQHVDVIPDPMDPEEPVAFVVSGYDEQSKVERRDMSYLGNSKKSRPNQTTSPDSIDQEIADQDDYKKSLERFVVWSKPYSDYSGKSYPGYNFVMNGRGELVSSEESIYNPLGFLPFIDISPVKSFKFFVDDQSNICEFSVRMAAVLSEQNQNIRMQAWSQAYLKAEESYLKELQDVEIGPTRIVFLPVSPEPGAVDPEFGYANPGGDLKVGMEYAQNLLSMFLSSHGLDPDVISNDGNSKIYNSGFERYLAQLQRFSASKQDYDIFKSVEEELLKIIMAWHDVGKEQGLLNAEYLTNNFFDRGEVSVKYKHPQAVQTKAEQIAYHTAMIESRLGSRVSAIMEMKAMTEEQARRYIEKIDKEDGDIFSPSKLDDDFQILETQPKKG